MVVAEQLLKHLFSVSSCALQQHNIGGFVEKCFSCPIFQKAFYPLLSLFADVK